MTLAGVVNTILERRELHERVREWTWSPHRADSAHAIGSDTSDRKGAPVNIDAQRLGRMARVNRITSAQSRRPSAASLDVDRAAVHPEGADKQIHSDFLRWHATPELEELRTSDRPESQRVER